ncbi:MAG: periplasmic protein [Proteobacteria bacterium]|nr:periplasmic protein [Pseudomonadota bacterium]
MKLKQSLFSLLALGALVAPLSLSAEVDFEWRLSLNNRYHSDPYGYRYGLADRFRLPESRVIVILDSVREPADAYMIFRLAELSGRPYDYVLGVYRQNRYSSWIEIASLVGVIISSNDFNNLRHHHDLRDDYRYDSRRYDRYEDRRVIIKREEIYIPHVYEEQRRIYKDPHYKHDERHDSRDDRRDDKRDDRKDDRRDDDGRRH